MTRRKKITVAASAFGLLLIGLGLSLLFHRPGPPPGYDAITVGMCPDQVRAVLHAEPPLAIATDEGQMETYFLHEFDRGSVSVQYHRGMLLSKTFTPPPTLLNRLRKWANAVWQPAPAPTAPTPSGPPAE